MIRGLARLPGVAGAVACALATALGPPTAAAQKQDDKQEDKQPAPKTLGPPPAEIHIEGEYGGVVPGKAPPRMRIRKSPFPLLVWVGFQPHEGGGSRVFVQLTREVPFQQSLVGGTLVVSLTGPRFATRNARRALDMRFFDSVLRRMDARAVTARRGRRGSPGRDAGIELRFSFKNPADARTAEAHLEAAQDGFHYLFLEFGPASAAPEPPAAP